MSRVRAPSIALLEPIPVSMLNLKITQKGVFSCPFFEALIFGLLQGLTEFLPVSSSAHLKLAKLFFNIEHSESQILFDLVCHLGTLSLALLLKRRNALDLPQ